ncbi:hypothetical protein MM_0003 [Methanosarcina mazei Go1]|uniref:Uncharacterized protein n=1 Tax=Methanosarcina mazei (strain ATCC BAA-159 / DSM 3647 / Goe1 / Go1 / JCM 11833 / OCM 88) TaxID=192952 RepID=Q8Q0X7_METMA|nr:hypothetical protein MM_0003 [Methanosarcina mazei Go1]
MLIKVRDSATLINCALNPLFIWHESAFKYFHFLGMLFEEYHVCFLFTAITESTNVRYLENLFQPLDKNIN